MLRSLLRLNRANADTIRHRRRRGQGPSIGANACLTPYGSRSAFSLLEEAMVYRSDRVVWGAVLFRTTNPQVVEGAIVRRSDRLHWTSEAAKEEVLGWMRELAQTSPTGKIEWQTAEDVAIGRFASDANHVAVIRSMLLPLGKSPRMK